MDCPLCVWWCLILKTALLYGPITASRVFLIMAVIDRWCVNVYDDKWCNMLLTWIHAVCVSHAKKWFFRELVRRFIACVSVWAHVLVIVYLSCCMLCCCCTEWDVVAASDKPVIMGPTHTHFIKKGSWFSDETQTHISIPHFYWWEGGSTSNTHIKHTHNWAKQWQYEVRYYGSSLKCFQTPLNDSSLLCSPCTLFVPDKHL